MNYAIWQEEDGTWSYDVSYDDGSLAAYQIGFKTQREARDACLTFVGEAAVKS